ncbi:dipeptide ABC transporter ATP-binding protein [Dactylosporangium sp. CA-092794]|uniref:dipeptide ABC transporter ATP-binding protein n=1 Tax=Dactylosporangium sp. CA-092794 TaxID=3239929 RepID=UPI003D8F658A
MTAELLRIEDLRVRFAVGGGRVDAVLGLDLTVGAGEIVALVGESGSGKTATAKAVLGLLPRTATATGRVLLRPADGSAPLDVLRADARALRRLRGTAAAMVFQEPATALNPVYPVGWQIAEGLRAHGVAGRKARRARAVQLLDAVGIPEPHLRVEHYPHQFSGGQQQRVVIAAALALDARLIVADEPTSALDVTVQAEILELLRRCRDDFGTGILLITHNMGVVADVADRVAVMHRGRVVEQAPATALFAAPAHDYTRELLAAIPVPGRSAVRVAPAEDAEPIVVADRLVVRYPRRLGRGGARAVDGVSFRIAAGEVLGLVGESGSGKTTIGRAIAGLVPISGGTLDVREPAGRLGYVFQDPATSFNPLLTVGDSVAEPLLVHRRQLGRAAVRARVGELLELVELPAAHAGRYPHELSGGQRQRAGLARALALGPRLLIADEPTSALDVSVQARILELLVRLHRELGFAALFISHDLAVVEAVADRVLVLREGAAVELGDTRQVLHEPRHPYTRRLVAAAPVPDPVRQAARRAEAARAGEPGLAR